MDKKALIFFIQEAIKEAAQDNDGMWIGGIKQLIESIGLTESDFKEKEVYKLLMLADW